MHQHQACTGMSRVCISTLRIVKYMYVCVSVVLHVQVCEAHTEWGRSFQIANPPLPAPDWGSLPEAPERLSVGYLSADLYTHSVSYFAEAPLRHHNPDRWGTLLLQGMLWLWS